MRYTFFSESEKETYPICFLVPLIRKDAIQKAYLEPYALDRDDIIVIDLAYDRTKKKTPVADIKTYITEELVPTFENLKVEYIVVTDSEYFKVLTKCGRVDPYIGYVLDCVFGPWKVVYVPNFKAIFHDPIKVTTKIKRGINAVISHRNGTYEDPGTNLLDSAEYPESLEDIEAALVMLLELNKPLAIDIEAFSLKHHTAGIGTIAFAWSETEGIAFAVDYEPIPDATEAPFGRRIHNHAVRRLLKQFFILLRQKAIYHHISYDVYVLIYQLFMKDILDTEGLLEGIDVMLRDWDDTKLITYLATNSCAGNKLGLKDQSHEFTGNYAMGEDIVDIRNIPLSKLLPYNLIDACATNYVHRKHTGTMIAEQQLDVYEKLFKPSTVDIIQMQLTGMPVNMQTVKKVKAELQSYLDDANKRISESCVVQEYTYLLNEQWLAKENARLKVKRKTLADAKEVFNPNSGPQLQYLLYEMLKLPVIDYTDNRLPATGAKTLKSLINHAQTDDVKVFLGAMLDYSSVYKLLTSFVPALENAAEGPDGWHYLFGNFNLGGTLSGRLSSSNPNLQNIPTGAAGEPMKMKIGKLIKSCFEAPPGWVFAGLDFSSLEDRISALTTKDPNKIKVYTDGYDGHSLRALAYFKDQMADIDENSVESVNSIQFKYKSLRQKSKNPTFSLTYMGTWNTLVNKYAFTPELAKQVEQRYHELYVVSDEWVAARLNQAGKDGYLVIAFGLRVRTPLLTQVIRGTSKTPQEAEAEARSAGNALGQSWCLLNSRAGNEFLAKVRKSDHRLDVRPCAQIHDAQYYLVREDLATLAYTNKHLVDAVQWQDDPEIWHDEVKIGGELSIFWPTWSNEIIIPNGATEPDIMQAISKGVEDYNGKQRSS